MPQPTAPSSLDAPATTDTSSLRTIYIACPWTPVGGGMFKVADYLIQAQGEPQPGQTAQLRPLDTRGAGSAAASMLVLAQALARLVRGRLSGRLAGVHVNMAERLSLVRKSVVVAASRALGLPVVLHLHAAQLHRAYPDFPGWAKALVRWVFSLPQSVIVLGQASADFVIRELGVPARRVEIVINGVPAPSVPRAAERPGPARILFVGNLSERKGVSDLLRALAQPRLASLSWQACFAGGGDLEGYRAKAAGLGLAGRVDFAGWTDSDRLAQLLSQADVLVLPSYDEGLPLAILEALAHGVAVVCTPVGEIPHVLTDGHNACFVQAGDADSIAGGLARVLGDPALRRALEHNGQALFRQQFSLDRFYENIAALHARHFGIAGAPPVRSEAAAKGRE
ncbi:glycosyltransferase family 4 protein [Ramlibacter rhizophilus]|uniref:Glycosyltransferase family 1 protein n=1 Tax=Ramlibacter rhizophilus TaxID=1781167 RepID=A0A4Z0BMJ0_9BURK|nr:glycosyltransferase family 4 protein [Ramlibacter rhizophilus]TFZ00002.1 glycosyltransferase family 1 protein [Ramlibacter rhizophilus]